MKRLASGSASALSIIEILVASSIGTLAMAALFSGVIAIQRCFVAAEDYAAAKVDQARLSDYIALDLRRALTVTAGGPGNIIMTIQIPDYYDGLGQPRTPTITNYVASYGNPSSPVTVIYRKEGASVLRQENGGASQVIARDVEDFQLLVRDLGKVIKTQVTFAPRFQRTPTVAARTATTVYGTTLLRNKRKTP